MLKRQDSQDLKGLIYSPAAQAMISVKVSLEGRERFSLACPLEESHSEADHLSRCVAYPAGALGCSAQNERFRYELSAQMKLPVITQALL